MLDWPEHQAYLIRRFADDAPALLKSTDEVAGLVLLLAGSELERYCADYHWMCDNFVEEELFFRRRKTYRYSSFAEVERAIYGNGAYMQRYVRGILLSQVFWRNHAEAMNFYRSRFLAQQAPGCRHLEVGPGHGLFLHFAAELAGQAVGWDVSPASIAATRNSLATFGTTGRVELCLQDVAKTGGNNDSFDGIVASELLEHLEDPVSSLANLARALSPSGRMYLNIPVNSPAPDHIYLWRSPEDVVAMVEQVGLKIEEMALFPISGYSVERARAMRVALSTVIIARH